MFAEIGGGCYIEPPHADRGGHHVHFGSNVYANLGLTPEDDTHIFIGGDTVVGAGSVVTHDLPGGVADVGVPCRVVRPIGDGDRICYFRDRRIQAEEPTAAAENGAEQ